MAIGLLMLHLRLPGCGSLKEKRSRLKPLLSRLHREYNISAAEVDLLDVWQESVVACAVVSNDARHNDRLLQKIVDWVERDWPDVDVIAEQLEMF